MDGYGDVKSKKFTAVTQTLSGRVHVRGIVLVPKVAGSGGAGTAQLFGTFQFKNGTSGGDIVIEIPVVAGGGFASVTALGFADDDGYVLFEDGIYLDQDADGRDDPDDWFSVLVFYSG